MKLKNLFCSCLLLALTACVSNPNYEKAQRATVLLESSHGYGSGFVIKRNHRLFVFTAAHVVTKENTLKVRQVIRFENRKVGEAQFTATVIARDESLDLALLILDAPPEHFSHVEFEVGPTLPVGSPVYIVGNFHGPVFDGSVTTGVISQIGVLPPKDLGFPWPIADQMSSVVVPGASGGPVFNNSNRVIGVTVGHATPGVEFFVPLRAVDSFARASRVAWILHGFWCPNDAALIQLAARAAYKEPEHVSEQIMY